MTVDDESTPPTTPEAVAAADPVTGVPPMAADPMPRIRMETSDGPLVFELWHHIAPRHADNFRQLIHDGFYDGLTFHRIIPGFIVQAGCPHGDGTGGPGYQIDAEFNDQPHQRGTLSMARTADPNSAGSQFFICLDRANCAHLDGEYTAFGRVVDNLETLDRLAASHLMYPELGTPSHPPQILHCYEVWDQSPTADATPSPSPDRGAEAGG